MRKRTRTIAIAIAVAIAAAGASGAEAVAAAGPRPFGATLEGHSNAVPTSDPCVLTITEGGTGKAVHMGAIAWASSETLNLCSNPEGADVQGELVMTAANGDEVFGRYVSLVRPDFQAGVFTFTGRWEIVSGTGRFRNVTGEGTLSGGGSLVPPFQVMASMVGSISY